MPSVSYLPRCLSLVLLFVCATPADAADEKKPIIAEGRPDKFTAGESVMYAVYIEDGVWNLRTTSEKGKDNKPGARVVFSGSVRAEGDKIHGNFKALEKSKTAENADFVVNHKDGKGFDFKFATFGGTDGIKFTVGEKAESLTFKLNVNGDDDPKKIFIGKKGFHPKKAEFDFAPDGRRFAMLKAEVKEDAKTKPKEESKSKSEETKPTKPPETKKKC